MEVDGWFDGLVGSPCRSLTEVLGVIPAGEGGSGAGSDLSMMSLILMSQVTLLYNVTFFLLGNTIES